MGPYIIPCKLSDTKQASVCVIPAMKSVGAVFLVAKRLAFVWPVN